VILLFVVEYVVIFWLINILLAFYPQVIYVGLFILFGLTPVFFQFQANFGFDKINGAGNILQGMKGPSRAMAR